jgi:hypothetical protein
VTAAEWLAVRADRVPETLRGRLAQALAAASRTPGDTVADELIRAAERTLARALDSEAMTRAQALDVLVADALATYAFEAGAEPGALVDCTTRGFARIAGLGGAAA